MMTFQEVMHGSELYSKSLELREQVLRIPLGLTLSDEDVAGEEQQRHFILVADTDLLACVVVKLELKPVAKLRQMAVSPVMQGRGLGHALLRDVEQWLLQHEFEKVVLDARESVLGFYQSLGYRVDGSVFQQVGIAHRHMHKQLA